VADCRTVAGLIARVVDDPDDEGVKSDVSAEVAALCEANPLYE
jgi:glycine hydroxymethyltransferase